jgi:hypothetical protein
VKLGVASSVVIPGTPKVAGLFKADWLIRAARRLGHEVLHSTQPQELERLTAECDLVIFAHRSHAGRWANVRSALENRKCPVVYWWWDLVATHLSVPISEQPLFKSHQKQFHAADVVLVKERCLLQEYRKAGVNAYWCDQGCPAELPAMSPKPPEWDVLLWGQSSHYRQRVHDVEVLLDAGFRVAWASSQPIPKGCELLPWQHPFNLPQFASRASCVLSCGIRNDIDGYWSDAMWLALGMGACVVRRRTPGLPDGPYLVYQSDDDLKGTVRWVVKNRKSAVSMGQKARQWVMERHTIDHYLQRAIQIARTAAALDAG